MNSSQLLKTGGVRGRFIRDARSHGKHGTSVSFSMCDPCIRQSDGGDEGEIFEPLAHCKIISLETTFPTVHLCLILPATLAPLWPLCSASLTSQPSLTNPLTHTEPTLTAFLPFWGCWSRLNSLCRDLLDILSPDQVCGRCLV